MADKKNVTKADDGKQDFAFAFDKTNYILMGIGLVLLLLGYILLSGGGSDDPNVFNNAMFDTRRLVISPIVITLGLVIEVVAIMKKPKEK
ncbi:MAG: DUF3098 domain-containing protein [Bacteroidales bacterium]|nr:DUF3098 domain-containing protein [Bacteroidales bacterium]